MLAGLCNQAGTTTAAYLAGLATGRDPFPSWESGTVVAPRHIAALWAAGCDIARALWDEADLLFLIDVDYQNIDDPGAPFLRPADVFVKLEPTYRAVRRVLADHDIHPLAVVTGRGYHVIGRIPLGSPTIHSLRALAGTAPAWFATVADRRPPAVEAHVQLTERQATAWYGLGLVVEFLAHEVLAEAQPESRIPVVMNGTIVGAGMLGRECTSVDVSHFGDPLDVRHVRLPYSTYQWHRARPDIFGSVSRDVPALATFPRSRAGLLHMLDRGLGLAAGLDAAAEEFVVPDVSRGVAAAAALYRSSPLAKFHDGFLADWRSAGRAARVPDPESAPPCVRAALDRPNDLLLKPEHLQHVVRSLSAMGWPAADVARLVQQKYDEDHAWGKRWQWMHAATRAEFDVRVFAGLLATGHDGLVDFNCVSAQEKALCPGLPCRRDLRDDRERLRRRAGGLAPSEGRS